MNRRGPWIALALVAVLGVVAANRSDEEETVGERIERISEGLRCLECQGETVAESQSGFANAVRSEISRLIDLGASDAEIRTELARGREKILLSPRAEGSGVIVWVLPIVVIAAAAGGLGFTFARWRRQGRLVADADDEVLVAQQRRDDERET